MLKFDVSPWLTRGILHKPYADDFDLRAAINDLTASTTNTKQTADIASCDMTAAESVKSLIFDKTRPSGRINPNNPTTTAACMRCLRMLSPAFAAIPRIAITIPKNAGIRAVTLAFSFIKPYPYPATPIIISKTPKIIDVNGIVSYFF